MKEPIERSGTKDSSHQTSMREASGTTRWTVIVLLIVAALIILLPLRNLPETHQSARIILSTIVLAICGLIAVWNKPAE